MRILLIKPSSLGDIVHALPVASALRRHPGVEAVDWVVNSEFAPVLAGNPALDRVLEFPRRHPRRLAAFVRRLREVRYGRVIDLQGLLRSALIARAARADERIGMSDSREGARWLYAKVAPVRPGHAIDRYLQVLDFAGVERGHLEFPLPGAGVPLPDGVEPPFLVVHPHARWATKALPDDWVRRLVRALAPRRVVIVGRGAPVEAEGARDLTNRTTFPELLAVLRAADGVISSDSGPMHLAAALGRPLVAVFGPTAPGKTGPWTANSRVVRLDLACAPCESRRCRNPERLACLERIGPEEILRALASAAGAGP